MAKSLHIKISQSTQYYFRIVSRYIRSTFAPIKKSLMRHKLPVFTVGSLLLLSTPVGVAHFRNNSTQQSPVYGESQLGIVGSNISNKSSASSDRLESSTEQSAQSSDANSSSTSSTNLSNSQNADNGGRPDSVAPQLTINGQNVPIPANGSVHKNVQSNNQSVDVRVNNNSSSSANQSSSLNIQIQSHSTSSDNNAPNTSRDRLITPKSRGY